jgi:L-malate glycosyltransferase
MPLRIVHIAAPAPFGGLEQVVRTLSEGQRRQGHDAHVVAIVDAWLEGHPFVDALEVAGVPVHTVPVGPRRYLHERRQVRSLIRALRPDVVHTHGYRADVLSAPVARSLGVATVTTVHGFIGGGWKNRLYERLQRRSFRRANVVVAVSSEQRDQLAADSQLRDRVRLIPNQGPVAPAQPLNRDESRRKLGIPPDAFAFGWVGRLSREKGPDVMLDGLELLTASGWHATFVGAGPLEAELTARARTTGLGDRVLFTGAVPEAARYFAAFDALVLTSRSEGMPIVLLEAIAAGLPVIATRVGGVPEALSGRGGLIVPSESPAELADALDVVMRDPAAGRISAASDGGADGAGGGDWLVAYERVYREAMGSWKA